MTDNQIPVNYKIEFYGGPYDGDTPTIGVFPVPQAIFVKSDTSHRKIRSKKRAIVAYNTQVTMHSHGVPGSVAYRLGSILSDGTVRYQFDYSFVSEPEDQEEQEC